MYFMDWGSIEVEFDPDMESADDELIREGCWDVTGGTYSSIVLSRVRVEERTTYSCVLQSKRYESRIFYENNYRIRDSCSLNSAVFTDIQSDTY